MNIISILKDKIDVRDGFKIYSYFTTDEVEDVINDIYLIWNVTFAVFGVLYRTIVLLQCLIKDIIIETIIKH